MRTISERKRRSVRSVVRIFTLASTSANDCTEIRVGGFGRLRQVAVQAVDRPRNAIDVDERRFQGATRAIRGASSRCQSPTHTFCTSFVLSSAADTHVLHVLCSLVSRRRTCLARPLFSRQPPTHTFCTSFVLSSAADACSLHVPCPVVSRRRTCLARPHHARQPPTHTFCTAGSRS